MTEHKPEEKTPTPEPVRQRYLNWPREFYVCKTHKEELFAEYNLAIVGPEELCVICNPVDNDSLGG